MKIENVHLITFSPTHTSKRVGEAIVRGLGIENSKKVDLTFQALDEYEIPTTDLALISVPVYGGKVAPLALQRLEGIRSNGAPVVLVVVYGNRAYEKALQNLAGAKNLNTPNDILALEYAKALQNTNITPIFIQREQANYNEEKISGFERSQKKPASCNGRICHHCWPYVYVGDDAVLQRHVEIATHQNALAGNIQVFYGLFAQIAHTKHPFKN